MKDPNPEIPLYNSRIIYSYLKLLRKRYGHVDIEELLSYAGMRECEIRDQGHWFTQRQVNLFHEKLIQLSGATDIAREAGRYAASMDSLGFVRDLMLGLIGPEYVLKFIAKLAADFSRSSSYTSRKVGAREIEITVTFAEGVKERPFQCQNRIGYFETIFLLFNYDYPQIRHTECIFNGAAVCRYLISWQPVRSSRLLIAARVSFVALAAALVLLLGGATDSLPTTLLLGMIPLHLLLSYLANQSERKSLLSSVAVMRQSSEQLVAQVQKNYDNALMINEIGQAISKKMDLEDILRSVNKVLAKRLNYSRGVILLANQDGTALVQKSCFGFSAEEEQELMRMEHPLDNRRGALTRSFLDQESFLVNGPVQVEELVRPEYLPVFRKLGVSSFICAPIVCEGESLGVLGVHDAEREGHLMQSDLNLIEGLAPVLGVAIRNAMHLANERMLSDQLRKASELLEKRVEERTAALSRAHEELESLYDSVSHDLRTPIRIIYGYGELLLDGYGGALDQTAKGYLQSVIAGGEQMEATLDRMLDYSRARVLELKIEPVDLSAMASRILADLRVTDKGRMVAARVQQGVVLCGDESLLKSVMENLIGNAWKYCAGKGVTTIEFGMADGVCFVRDNGAGFDMAYSYRLFRPFHRLHDSQSFAGHGLGLATVRRMLERMGGRVWAEAKPGVGATFYFSLPSRSLSAGAGSGTLASTTLSTEAPLSA